MTKLLRCAIYTRKSSEEGLEQNFNSLHAQRESCEAYVLSQAGEGWSALAAAYDDGGYSGGSMDRPGLKQLLADITSGLVDVVVVYKVDRLTRSLADFAKIVELFDATSVSFVSVTQAFNTTSSMGRLTLNVLLSFAQFEREVTGERIRDKIAASKAKGLRMGGVTPLGYDNVEGRLQVNVTEAAEVTRIFERYLELGSLSRLERDGVFSRVRIAKDGRQLGGSRMGGGSLRYLLSNPVYRGVNRHKEKAHADCHPPIVPEKLWGDVQRLLEDRQSANGGRALMQERGKLTGRLFDDRGNAMKVVHTQRRGKYYRYYVSNAKLGHAGTPGSLARISTAMVETFIAERCVAYLASSFAPEQCGIDRVIDAARRFTLSDDQIVIVARHEALSPDGLEASTPGDGAGCRILRLPFHMRRTQGAITIEPAGAATSPSGKVDRALVRAVVLARQWANQLETGQAASIKALAHDQGLCHHYTSRLLPLAYLSPDITTQILEGRQSKAITLSSLTASPLPLTWDAQAQFVRRAASQPAGF